MAPLLTIRDLRVRFLRRGAETVAVDGLSLEVLAGETLALVGESGSGKSVTALSILQLLPPGSSLTEGSIRFLGEELVGARAARLRAIRGNRIAMVFQEPMSSLNPLLSVEQQLGEVLGVHKGLAGEALRARSLELLRLVRLPEPERRLAAFPHQLSGGQLQRVMIAMALANEPDLLIADEPTTALDVTIQAQILGLLQDLRRRFDMALLLITHDFQVVRKMAERVVVMRAGRVVETAPVRQLFASPAHPYTRELLEAEPKGTPEILDEGAPALLVAAELRVRYELRAGLFRRRVGYVDALDGVDLQLREGETLGVVGESGSGKTTLGRAVLRLVPARGAIRFEGHSLHQLDRKALRPLRRRMQIVFQDPFGSLSPRMSLARIVSEGLRVNGLARRVKETDRAVCEALEDVGIDPAWRQRYPHELSGGQRQRVAIARAIILRPRLIVLDEPTSALDRSVQAQIVELLRALQRRYRIAYLFISHDLKVVRALANQVMVLKDGRMVEFGDGDEIFVRPRHPYTKALLAAAFELEAAGTEETRT